MIIKDKVKEIAERLVYDTFEITTDTANVVLDDTNGVSIGFNAGEIKVYVDGVYYIDFKSTFYKDDVFKPVRDELDKYKDKDLTDDELYNIAREVLWKIDEDENYYYYVCEADSYFDIDMRNSIQWFNRSLGDAVISAEGDNGEVIEGRVREVLEEEYGHYEVIVRNDIILGFSDFYREVLIDYMCR